MRLDSEFGSDHFDLWQFRSDQLFQNDVTADFLKRIGSEAQVSEANRVNESLSLAAIKVLYCYRRFGGPAPDTSDALRSERRFIRRLSEVKGERLAFSEGLVRDCLNRIGDEIAWVEAKTGCEFPDPTPGRSLGTISGEDDLFHITGPEWEQIQATIDVSHVKQGPGRPDPAELGRAIREIISQCP